MKTIKLKFLQKTSSNSKIFLTNIFNLILKYLKEEENAPFGEQKDKIHRQNEKRISLLTINYPQLWYIYLDNGTALNHKYVTLIELLNAFGLDVASTQIFYDINATKVKTANGEPVLKLFFDGIYKRDISEKINSLACAISDYPQLLSVTDKFKSNIKIWLAHYKGSLKEYDAYLKQCPMTQEERMAKTRIITNNIKCLEKLEKTINQLNTEK